MSLSAKWLRIVGISGVLLTLMQFAKLDPLAVSFAIALAYGFGVWVGTEK